MNVFSILTEKFKDYSNQIVERDGIKSFEIINPFWEENINIVDENNELTFYFSYQHAHFDYNNINELIQYINEFLTSKRLVIEFFVDDISAFGGDREINELESTENILKSFLGDDPFKDEAYASDKTFSCKIRGWNNKDNKDVIFN